MGFIGRAIGYVFIALVLVILLQVILIGDKQEIARLDMSGKIGSGDIQTNTLYSFDQEYRQVWYAMIRSAPYTIEHTNQNFSENSSTFLKPHVFVEQFQFDNINDTYSLDLSINSVRVHQNFEDTTSEIYYNVDDISAVLELRHVFLITTTNTNISVPISDPMNYDATILTQDPIESIQVNFELIYNDPMDDTFSVTKNLKGIVEAVTPSKAGEKLFPQFSELIDISIPLFTPLRDMVLSLNLAALFFIFQKLPSGGSSSSGKVEKNGLSTMKEAIGVVTQAGAATNVLSDNLVKWTGIVLPYLALTAIIMLVFPLYAQNNTSVIFIMDRFDDGFAVFLVVTMLPLAVIIVKIVANLIEIYEDLFDEEVRWMVEDGLLSKWHYYLMIASIALVFILPISNFIILWPSPAAFGSSILIFILGLILQPTIISLGLNNYYANDVVRTTRLSLSKIIKNKTASRIFGLILAIIFIIPVGLAFLAFLAYLNGIFNVEFLNAISFMSAFNREIDELFFIYEVDTLLQLALYLFGSLFGSLVFYLESKESMFEEKQRFYGRTVQVMVFGQIIPIIIGVFIFAPYSFLYQEVFISTTTTLKFNIYTLIFKDLRVILMAIMATNFLGYIMGFKRLWRGVKEPLEELPYI